MTIPARGEKADDVPVPENGLVVEEQRFRILEFELQKSPLQSQIAFAQHGLPTNELAKATAGLFDFDRKPEARLQDVVLIGDIMSEMAEGLLEPQRVHGQNTGRPQAQGSARLR